MGVNSRKKGKTGELEAVHLLNSYGFNTRRSQQFCGANNDADIVGIDGLHIEVKRVESLNIDKALNQSIADSKEDEVPIVLHRKNRTDWKVTMRAEDFIELWKEKEDCNDGKIHRVQPDKVSE